MTIPKITKAPKPNTVIDTVNQLIDEKQDLLTSENAGKSISIENSDGYNWTDYTVAQQEFGFSKVIFDGEKFVALTSSGVATSTDGATWTEITLEINVYNDIAYGNGKYVMVGNMGYIATSTNGTTWSATRYNILDEREYKYPDWQCVAYGDNKFVALSSKMSTILAGDTFAYAKGDGAGSFTLGFMGNDSYADDYKDIAYGNSGFVAVGAYSYIAKYNNSWAEYNIDGDYEIDGSYELKNVLYANGHYITPCYQGIFSSTNGTAWSFEETYALSSEIKDSIYVNDTYLYLDDYANLHVSSDLENWQNFNYSEDIGGNEVINSLAFGNGKLIIVGDEGTVITIDYFAGTRINCVVDSQLSSTSENPVQNSTIYNALDGKQATLVSGQTIKTINNSSILGSGNLTVTASAPSNMVTTDTTQNITGEKTFVGDKRVKFKQSTSSNKLGFTLYDNSGGEKGYLEFNPSNKIDNAPLMTLGNYATAAGNITQVGFRRYSSVSGANGAYNLLTPLIADAKTPFSLTTTYSNFYFPLGFKNGSTQVLTAKSGVADLSSLFPTIATSVSSSSTNSETVGAKLFYDTCGNIETLINAL